MMKKNMKNCFVTRLVSVYERRCTMVALFQPMKKIYNGVMVSVRVNEKSDDSLSSNYTNVRQTKEAKS